MATAQAYAASKQFTMDDVYRARLARGIRLELEDGTHYDDIEWAVKQLIDRQLSPGLLKRKVQDRYLPKTSEGSLWNPFGDFPEELS
jgi:hypothetical protein